MCTFLSPLEDFHNCQTGHFRDVLCRGFAIGLAGCGIWLIFVATFGMGAENRSGMREFELRTGAGFCVFKESGCGEY